MGIQKTQRSLPGVSKKTFLLGPFIISKNSTNGSAIIQNVSFRYFIESPRIPRSLQGATEKTQITYDYLGVLMEESGTTFSKLF